MIRRYRYAWEPQTYYQTDTGAPSGGGKPPEGQGGTGEGKEGGDPPKGGEGNDESGEGDPAKGKSFSQADVDRIVAQRLEDEKGREKKRTDAATKKAAEEAAAANGEWKGVAESRQDRIAALETEVAALHSQIADRDLSLIRNEVAAEYKLTPFWAARLTGKDKAELTADAKRIRAELPPPRAAETEAGRGNGQGGGRNITKEHEQAADASGRYTPY